MYTDEQQRHLLEDTQRFLKLDQQTFSFEQAEEVVNELRRVLRFHDYRYYVLAEPLVGDYEYDKLLRLLKDLEQQHPELVTDDSPTQRVAQGLTKEFPRVEHLVPMLSLDNSYDEDDLREWDRKNRKSCGLEEVTYSVEPKFDGAGISLIYEDDRLVRGASRGDGVVGEDITPNLKVIRSVPLRVRLKEQGIHRLEVRGEVLIQKQLFEKLNEERQVEGLTALANPRNTAAGALRLQDAQEVAKRKLDGFLYHISVAEDAEGNQLLYKGMDSHSENIQMLHRLGFKTPLSLMRVCKGIEEVVAFCHEWQERRDEFEYELDGLVVKVDSLPLQRDLGLTSHHPRWAMAYKFRARQATTILRDVVYQVGRVGTITPVAKLEPVELSGVTVTSASMFNEDFIRDKDIRIGDRVVVERAGDVIPYIVQPVKEARVGDESSISFPKDCPSCGAELVREEGESAKLCVNINCPAQVVERLKHFVSKDAMDISGFGSQNVKRFFELEMLRSIPDIYRLDYEQIGQLDRFGEKSLEKLRKSIEGSKEQPLHRLIFALGIRYVGKATGRVLADAVQCIEDLQEWEREKLEELPDIGPRVAESIYDFFHTEENLRMLQTLKELGVQSCKTEEEQQEPGALAGKTFLFTGSLQQVSRSEAKEMVESSGGKVSSSVSSKVDYLVVGEAAGSKLEKAKKMETITILSEEEFLAMLKK